MPDSPAPPKETIPTFLVGTICLIVVVSCWSISGFLTQNILGSYNKPFLTACLSNLCFMVYFSFRVFPDPVVKWIESREEKKNAYPNGTAADEKDLSKSSPPPQRDLSLRELAVIGAMFFPLYLTSNYLTNVGFGNSSVGSVSILASTCGFFTLIFGYVVGVEALSPLRCIATCIAFIGALLSIVWGGSSAYSFAETRKVGNACAIVGALFYGVYSVFLKKVSLRGVRICFPTLFAFSGLYTLLFMVPLMAILHFTGIERVEAPATSKLVYSLIINATLGGLLPNYLWNVAFRCTSPLAVAIGLSFTIVISVIGDLLFVHGSEAISIPFIGGGVLVIAGFILVNVASIYPVLDQRLKALLF